MFFLYLSLLKQHVLFAHIILQLCMLTCEPIPKWSQ